MNSDGRSKAEIRSTHDDSEPPDDSGSPPDHATDATMSRHYRRFASMIATAMVVMYILTYTNTDRLADVQWSQTRFYMVFVMGAAMAVIMLGFMLPMYKDRRINAAIVGGSTAVFIVALLLMRSQTGIGDVLYMKGMIPHHSIAILTSERANIDDVRVRMLADGIIEAQRREIAEMDWLIDDIAMHGKATTASKARARPVPDFQASNG